MFSKIINGSENCFAVAETAVGRMSNSPCYHFSSPLSFNYFDTDVVISCCSRSTPVSEADAGLGFESDLLLAAKRAIRRRKQEVGSVLHMRSVVAKSQDTLLRLMSSRSLTLSSFPGVKVVGQSWSFRRHVESINNKNTKLELWMWLIDKFPATTI